MAKETPEEQSLTYVRRSRRHATTAANDRQRQMQARRKVYNHDHLKSVKYLVCHKQFPSVYLIAT